MQLKIAYDACFQVRHFDGKFELTLRQDPELIEAKTIYMESVPADYSDELYDVANISSIAVVRPHDKSSFGVERDSIVTSSGNTVTWATIRAPHWFALLLLLLILFVMTYFTVTLFKKVDAGTERGRDEKRDKYI